MQTREEWLRWRQGIVGGSDAPALVGVSKYRNIQNVYEDKIATEIKEETSYIQERGNRIEPRVRALFEMKMGEPFDPCLVQLEAFPFIGASLDGRSSDKKEIIEIKLSGKEDYALAVSGKVPAHYYPQVQHNLLASQAEKCWYLSYPFSKQEEKVLSLEKLAIVEVFPDKEYQGRLIELESKFWFENVQKRKPPLASPDKEIRIIDGSDQLAEQYLNVDAEIDRLTSVRQELKDQLIKLADASGASKVQIGRLPMVQQSRVGNVEYAKIPELKGVDLDQYRKAGTTFWKVGK